MSLKPTSRWRGRLLKAALIVLALGVVGILSFSLGIELTLKRTCEMATRQYPGDKVEALTMSVRTEPYGYNAQRYDTNNRLVWALGQLGDQRALPFLRNLLTGQPCDHQTNLCQGEIAKAIQKLERDGFNLPAFLWRGIVNW